MCNLSQTTNVVKQIDEKTLYFLRFYLQDEAQHIISSAFPELRKKAFCKCHKRVISPSSTAQVYLNNETRRAYWHRVCTCANASLCPVCAPRIASHRCDEISHAAFLHLRSNPLNKLYLLTLTCRHGSGDQISDLLSSFKAAQSYFFGLRSVQNFFRAFGALDRITSHEVTYSLDYGYHPHAHILLFGQAGKFDTDWLSNMWIYCLRKYGLDGLSGIALQMQPADDLRTYLTKISQELVMLHLKEGRRNNHFTPIQLLHESTSCNQWARDAFSCIFSAYRGRHLLHWSRGLKAKFGIMDISDESIATNNADSERLMLVLEVPRKVFNSLPHYKRAEILADVSKGDYSKIRQFLSCCFAN